MLFWSMQQVKKQSKQLVSSTIKKCLEQQLKWIGLLKSIQLTEKNYLINQLKKLNFSKIYTSAYER